MCVVCVTVAATVVVASQVTPIEIFSETTATQRTLTSFSGSSSTLSTKQKSEIRTLVEGNPKANAVTCSGLTLRNASKAATAIARQRSKVACDYAKTLNPLLNATVVTRSTAVRSNAGRVTVQLRDLNQAAPPKTPGPIPPTPTEGSNSAALNSEICRLKENSRARKLGDPAPNFAGQKDIMGRYPSNATAFPFAPTALPVKGKINVSMVFVDWADSPGTRSDYDFYTNQGKFLRDFYWMVSENKLDIKITYSEKWFRMSGSYKDVSTRFSEELQLGDAPKKRLFFDSAVAASDSETDFSTTDVVLFAIPRGKSVFQGGLHVFNFIHNTHLRTGEGNIYNSAVAGDFFLTNNGQPPWVFYVHEIGHMIGIPHQANEDANKPNVEKFIVTPLGGWDIMSMQGGATRTITSWLRWLAGWLSDEQVICVTKDSLTNATFRLHPINEVKGRTESLVIKLNETKAIVVESRRHDDYFDISTGNSKNGVLIYTVDATKGSAQGNQVLLSPRDIREYLREKNTYPDWRELDAILFQGDSVEYEGLKIEVVTVGPDADTVRVTKN
jgi:M6 family metalloprotease-like protein